jgi:hypothetical protein
MGFLSCDGANEGVFPRSANKTKKTVDGLNFVWCNRLTAESIGKARFNPKLIMNRQSFRKISSVVIAVALSVGASASAFGQLTFVSSNGLRSASATFDVIAGNLQITLNNISTNDVTTPTGGGGILTTVFFDLFPPTTLTPVSALLGLGSVVHFGSDGGGNVGGEWAFASGLVGAPGNAALGASSSGLGLFGSGNFGGVDLDPPGAVNGLNYGITSAGDNLGIGNAAVTGSVPLIQSSVVFTLSGNPLFTSIGDYTISNVSFQYGTDLSEPRDLGVFVETNIPEPTAMSICALLLVPLASRVCRRNLASRG